MKTFAGLPFRIDPSNALSGSLAGGVGARRVCFNSCVDMIRQTQDLYAEQTAAGLPKDDRVKPMSLTDLRAAWVVNRPAWFGEHSWWLYDQAQRDAHTAQGHWLKGKSGFPRFTAKHHSKARYTVNGGKCRLEAGRLRLPVVGWVRICSPDPGQARLRRLIRAGKARMMAVTVTRRADDTWWATVKYERTMTFEPVTAPGMVGVDVGCARHGVAATTAGVVLVEAGQARRRRDAQPGIERAAQQMARRRVRGRTPTAGYLRAKATHAKRHARALARRGDDLHVLSKAIAASAGIVVLETLAVDAMMAAPKPVPDPLTDDGSFLPNGATAQSRLAYSLADAALGRLHDFITYKVERYGGVVLKAPRFYPSTRLCRACGAVRGKLPLGERTYHCEQCGHESDRDTNAAANLAAWGDWMLYGASPMPGTGTHPAGQGRTCPTAPHPGRNQPAPPGA